MGDIEEKKAADAASAKGNKGKKGRTLKELAAASAAQPEASDNESESGSEASEASEGGDAYLAGINQKTEDAANAAPAGDAGDAEAVPASKAPALIQVRLPIQLYVSAKNRLPQSVADKADKAGIHQAGSKTWGPSVSLTETEAADLYQAVEALYQETSAESKPLRVSASQFRNTLAPLVGREATRKRPRKAGNVRRTPNVEIPTMAAAPPVDVAAPFKAAIAQAADYIRMAREIAEKMGGGVVEIPLDRALSVLDNAGANA